VDVSIEGKEVLHDVTWEVKRRENWVIVGPNGAGKTSLLRLLNGYHWPSSGKARVLGKKFGSVDLRELRKKIGLVSSYITDWVPADERVLDVVLSGKDASIGFWKPSSPEDNRLAVSALGALGCERYKDSRFGRLSQGEKQKVVIARALMARPRLVALDEPCAGLDIIGRERLLSTLRRLASRGSPSLIYVTHRIEEIPEGFTHGILLKGGKIVKMGMTNEVLDDESLTACFGVKVKVNRWRNRYYAMVDD